MEQAAKQIRPNLILRLISGASRAESPEPSTILRCRITDDLIRDIEAVEFSPSKTSPIFEIDESAS